MQVQYFFLCADTLPKICPPNSVIPDLPAALWCFCYVRAAMSSFFGINQTPPQARQEMQSPSLVLRLPEVEDDVLEKYLSLPRSYAMDLNVVMYWKEYKEAEPLVS